MALDKVKSVPDILSGKGEAALVVTEGGPTFTRDSLRKAVVALSRELMGNGISKGDVVSFAMANTVEYIMLFFAITKAGAVAAPLNPAYKAAEFEFYMQDTSAKLLVLPPEGNSEAQKAAASLKVPAFAAALNEEGTTVQLGVLAGGQAPNVASVLQLPKTDPESVALFLHTSGTTSKPKGVPLLHRNLVTTVKNIIGTYELTSADKSYLVMPLFHVHGLMAGLLSALGAGGTVVLPKGGKFSASVFWKDVKEHGATWYTAVPTMHQILLAQAGKDHEGAALRFIRSCSASLAAPVLEQLEQTFGAPVLEAYAMTEAAHQMTSNPLPKHGTHKPGSVGKGVNVEITILSPEGTQLGVGEVGEVCIKGQNVTPGYHNRPEANVEAFAHGWFHTGDQGKLDADGYLTLTGRLKELINRGGEKISPLEVDSALLSCSSVAEAVAFGVPDQKFGEEVNAAVVLKPGEKISEADILAHAKKLLGDFKLPKQLFIADALPKTATGKIQRRFVAEHFLKPTSKL